MSTTQKIKIYFKTLTTAGKILYVLLGVLLVTSIFNPDNILLVMAVSLAHYMYTTDPGYCPRAKEIFAPKVESM